MLTTCEAFKLSEAPGQLVCVNKCKEDPDKRGSCSIRGNRRPATPFLQGGVFCPDMPNEILSGLHPDLFTRLGGPAYGQSDPEKNFG